MKVHIGQFSLNFVKRSRAEVLNHLKLPFRFGDQVAHGFDIFGFKAVECKK